MYPVPDYIYFGIHVQEQIEALKAEKDLTAEVYFINGREKKSNYFKSISDLKKKVSGGGYDLVHVHYGTSGLFLLFSDPKIPVVMTLHSGELFQKKGLINHMLQKAVTMAAIKKAKKIVVLNDTMIDLLAKHQDRLVKLPCGTNLELFKAPETTRQKVGQKIIIGFPGNKERKEKNFDLFQEIVKLLEASYEIEVIEFHNLTRDEVVRKLGLLDLLLMTSTIEGSPQIIKEAMACNRPIVSTAVGDVEDLLEGVKNSYVIDSFTAGEFIPAILSILALPIADRYSNGREKLLEMALDSRQVSQRLYSIYEEVI